MIQSINFQYFIQLQSLFAIGFEKL